MVLETALTRGELDFFRLDDRNIKALLGAEPAQAFDVPRARSAEIKIPALDDCAGCDVFNEKSAHKIFRREAQQFPAVLEHDEGIDAALAKQVRFHLQRGQDARGAFRVQDGDRMRLERHRDQFGPAFFGGGPGGDQNLLMAAVHAVEVANGQHTTLPDLLQLGYGPYGSHYADPVQYRGLILTPARLLCPAGGQFATLFAPPAVSVAPCLHIRGYDTSARTGEKIPKKRFAT
jgi:hypothetical protein